MSAIQTIGVKEFRANLYKYTRENKKPIALTVDGETIGYYIPTPSSPPKKNVESLRQAVIQLSAMLAEKGLSEDDIVADFQELRHKSHSISVMVN